MNQNCRSIRGWIQPVLAADGFFTFACLYFLTKMRWELRNGTQRSFDQQRNKNIRFTQQTVSSIKENDNRHCFCRKMVYSLTRIKDRRQRINSWENKVDMDGKIEQQCTKDNQKGNLCICS